jgi:hypothetical protein
MVFHGNSPCHEVVLIDKTQFAFYHAILSIVNLQIVDGSARGCARLLLRLLGTLFAGSDLRTSLGHPD